MEDTKHKNLTQFHVICNKAYTNQDGFLLQGLNNAEQVTAEQTAIIRSYYTKQGQPLN